MDVLEDLAQQATQYIWGVPWEDFTNDPFEDVYTRLGYIIPLRERMRDVMSWYDQIEWVGDVLQGPNRQQAIVAWYGVEESILEKENFVKSALLANAPTVSGEPPTMQVEIFRAFVTRMMSFAMQGFVIHSNLIYQHGGSDPKLIVNNADGVHALLQALQFLWDNGFLDSLRKRAVGHGSGGSVSGMGAAPVIGAGGVAVIAVAAVAALAILAWAVLKMQSLAAQWSLADNICEEAMKDPTNKSKIQACKDAQKAINDVTGEANPYDAMNTVAVFVGIGVLMYAGALILPDLLVGLKRARYR